MRVPQLCWAHATPGEGPPQHSKCKQGHQRAKALPDGSPFRVNAPLTLPGGDDLFHPATYSAEMSPLKCGSGRGVMAKVRKKVVRGGAARCLKGLATHQGRDFFLICIDFCVFFTFGGCCCFSSGFDLPIMLTFNCIAGVPAQEWRHC